MISRVDEIQRIMVVDDNPNVRDDYSFFIDTAEREPVVEVGPLGSLQDYLSRPLNADAAVSDHNLTPSGYATFDGAHLVAEWYKRGFPAILCTTFARSNADQFRSLRRWLPVVISPAELTPESLLTNLGYVQQEIEGAFVPPRRPWRALVHFVDFDDATRTAYVKLPGWSREAVALRLVDLPVDLRTAVSTQSDFRCYAHANLGSESNDDLYISGWEI